MNQNNNNTEMPTNEKAYIPVIPIKARCGQTKFTGEFSTACLLEEIQSWFFYRGCSDPLKLFLSQKISWIEREQMLALELAFEQTINLSYLVIELPLGKVNKYIKSDSRLVLFAQTKEKISEDSKTLNRLIDQNFKESWEKSLSFIKNIKILGYDSPRPRLVFPCRSRNCSLRYDRFRIEIQSNEVFTHELFGISIYEILYK